MQIDTSVKGNMDGEFDTSKVVNAVNNLEASKAPKIARPSNQQNEITEGKNEEESAGKQPSRNTIQSVVSEVNQKMRMTKTRCEYSYDEPTKRVSIKVYDKDTEQLIREVPPEKSLEMLQKMWELAGIMLDEKR